MQRLMFLSTPLLVLLIGCPPMQEMDTGQDGTGADQMTGTQDTTGGDGSDADQMTGNQGTTGSGGTFGIFTVQGATATMNGDIDTPTPQNVRQMLAANPGLTTIVMANVPGSADDDANLEAARLVRQANLNTHIPAGPGVASGGTDFFLAGVVRTADAGAILGVHSWASGNTSGRALQANDPNWRTNPEHTSYINYYTEMGLADPEGFYLFTLSAAATTTPEDYEGIHNMSVEELNRYGMCSPDPCP